MRLIDLSRDVMEVPARWRELEVRGLACDSRQVRDGYLFVAVPGASADGHTFIPLAVESGAVAIVGERKNREATATCTRRVPYLRVRDIRGVLAGLAARFYGHPSERLRVTGVTGTKGKTSTTWLLDAILRRAGKETGLFGTVENRVGKRTFSSRNTTAGVVDLQHWLRQLLDLGGTHATLEVSSHALDQRRTEGIRFQCAVFTNISPEHLDYHGTFENYLEAKTRLYSTLPASSVAVLPREERHGQQIASRTPATIAWYGMDAHDGVERLRAASRGMEFVWKGRRIRSRLFGLHNVLNALAAMTAAESLGVERSDIAAAIENAVLPPGRLEQLAVRAPFRVIVDYAHTDSALEAVLLAIRPLTTGRVITVFGCGGDRDREKRPRMGRAAELGSDHIIVTSDNPRGEAPQQILDDIARGLRCPQEAVFVEDRREAIGLGIRMAREGDTVLIAGKGHETYQEFKDRVVEFDDRNVARDFLREASMGMEVLGG